LTPWVLAGLAVAMLVGRELFNFAAGRSQATDVVLSAVVGAVVVAAVLSARASGIELERRHSESESFGRIVRALSRSVTFDEVVSAIVHELGTATAADHVAVARLGPGARSLEVVFASMLPGMPTSRTSIPVPRPPGPSTAADIGAGGARGGAAAAAGADGDRNDGDGQRDRARAARESEALSRRIVGLIAGHLRDSYGLRNTISAPLRSDRELTGAIVLSRRTAEVWPEPAIGLLRRAALEASAVIERIQSQQAAESDARTDPLTGLPNRRAFDEYSKVLASHRRASDKVAIVEVDIDHFKRLNDVYGHQVGDEVLKAVAGAIAASVRDDDVPVRFGGEEFVILLRNPAEGVAVEVGERMRCAVRELDLAWAGVTDRVTISVGVAAAKDAEELISDVVERADRALYAAKRAGRDRVVESWRARSEG
jgi:diguanylate cyclase (GGDEF)-like protein